MVCRLRIFCFVVFAALSTAIQPNAFCAETVQYRVVQNLGRWQIAAYYGASGDFLSCTALVEQADPALFLVYSFPDGRWRIGFSEPTPEDESIQFYVDRRLVLRGRAAAIDGLLVLPMPNSLRVIGPLRTGQADTFDNLPRNVDGWIHISSATPIC